MYSIGNFNTIETSSTFKIIVLNNIYLIHYEYSEALNNIKYHKDKNTYTNNTKIKS